MITPRICNFEVPATLPLPNVDPALSRIREQFLALSLREQERLQALLEVAEQLDRQLSELHLVLPLVQIEFFGLEANAHNRIAYHPTELLSAIDRWKRSAFALD